MGNLFRTDGSSTVANSWSLFTGATTGSVTEKFRLFVPANSNDAVISTIQNGAMQFSTNSTIRMHINQDGTVAAGTTTSGFVGIGTNNPVSPLHIQGSQIANAFNWNRGLTLSNNATIYFDAGNTAASFFMGHPSVFPADNFYAGSATSLNSAAAVDYSFTIYTNTPLGGNPLRSAHFFKNLLVSQVTAPNVTAANERRVGINTLSPQNILEINTAAVSPIPGNSGLRFTDLTSASNLLPNPGTGVLSVDANGDVIYVPSKTFGSVCGDTINPYLLPDHSEIQLNNFNFHFSDIGGSKDVNNVGIGTNCTFPLPAKLSVFQKTNTRATTAFATVNVDNADPTSANGSSVAIFGKTTGTHSKCTNIAGWFEAVPTLVTEGMAIVVPRKSGKVSIGFAFSTSHPSVPSTPPNEPEVCGQLWNNPSGNVQLEVSGDIFASGGVLVPSDEVFKNNIDTVVNALGKIKKLNGVYFHYDTLGFPEMQFPAGRQIGLIAQNVDTVINEAVSLDTNSGYYSLRYDRIIPVLIEAIKEQSITIDSMIQIDFLKDSVIQSLQAQNSIQDSLLNSQAQSIAIIQQCLNNTGICNTPSAFLPNTPKPHPIAIESNTTLQQIELKDMERVVLDQNVPNPFAEQTIINYYLPQNVQRAQMLFYDHNGRLINTVDLNGTGAGQLQVFANDLSNGIYQYVLVVDGEITESKKLVKMD